MVKNANAAIVGTVGDTEPIREPGNGTRAETSGSTNQPISTANDDDLIAGFEVVDPTDVGGNTNRDAAGGTGKRRGRPPGSRNSTSAKTPKNLEGIESLLLSVHFMGATILGTPELALDPEESKKLSNAIQNVAQYYPVGLSPKMMAWINLGMVAGGIYGTRMVAIYKRMETERMKKTKIPFNIVSDPTKTPFNIVSDAPQPNPSKPNGKAAPGPLSPSELYGSSGVTDD